MRWLLWDSFVSQYDVNNFDGRILNSIRFHCVESIRSCCISLDLGTCFCKKKYPSQRHYQVNFKVVSLKNLQIFKSSFNFGANTDLAWPEFEIWPNIGEKIIYLGLFGKKYSFGKSMIWHWEGMSFQIILQQIIPNLYFLLLFWWYIHSSSWANPRTDLTMRQGAKRRGIIIFRDVSEKIPMKALKLLYDDI